MHPDPTDPDRRDGGARRRSHGGTHWTAFSILYVLASVYATWPLARGATGHLVSHFSPEDILLHTWNLTWDVHALLHHPTRLFDANILHPATNTLALSEHLLGQLPLFAPVWLLTGNPVLAINADIFLGFVLSGLFTHFLVFRWTDSSIAALAAGMGFAFAPWRLDHFHWPQLLSVQYFPLVLYAFDRAIVSRRFAWGVAAGAVLTLQMLCSYYLAYMALLLVGCFVFVRLLFLGMTRWRQVLRPLAIALALPLLVMAAISIPYVRAKRAGVLVYLENVPAGQIAVVLAWMGNPWRVLRSHIGWGMASVAALSLVTALRALRSGDRDVVARIAALALTVVLAIGVASGPLGLGGWFAPYAWLSKVVPGFSDVRGPLRFGFLASFCMSVLAGLAVASLLDLLRRAVRPPLLRTALTAVAGTVIVAMVLLPLWSRRPPRAIAIPTGSDVPSVYRWLAEHGEGGPLLELPVQAGPPRTGTKACKAEALAMYFSTYHWLPILNGYSGYIPDSYPALMEHAARLPDPDALRVLVDCADLRWVLIRESDPRTRQAWDALVGVEFRGVFPRSGGGTDLVYEVVLRRVSDCPLPIPPRPADLSAPPQEAPSSLAISFLSGSTAWRGSW